MSCYEEANIKAYCKRTDTETPGPCVFPSLPKPAIVSQLKGIASMQFWSIFNFKHEDRVYIVTPLYHGVATNIALFNALKVEYFDDCRRYGVTVIQYIGELLRYLLHQPERENDSVHKIRVAFGNGLRTDVWEKFQSRFKIPWIVEFFGASEGVGVFLNCSNRVGAIGKHSPFMVGEEGLIISAIPAYQSGFYKGPKELDNKKIIKNVFKDGDRYFNFGDLAYMDQDYFLYFRDRLGDTFRYSEYKLNV
ncbi:hypothetical protein KUTeg_017805 [Tegillarca granosa]|uniref:Long-chain-fatty-acid--CoA ligase n=1 Tax=Tegillarca granosa TaxID=220873 RepID=A0ABQ9EG01_TEGGR|nr:hypothetical protein KUTeg_017805 [Tegillarca granosa]